MKRVKIMLLSTLVVAVVGGALAFKAAKFNDTFYCSDTPQSCPTTHDFLSETTINPIPNLFCSTESTSTSCPIRVTNNR